MKKSFKEEWRLFLNSKVMWAILFVLPLLTVVLIGVEFDGEVIRNVPMAVLDMDQTTFSRMLIDSFDQNETFRIDYFPDSEKVMETLFKNSKVKVGMIIPKGFAEDVANLNAPEVLMVYDGSQMSVTSVTKAKAMEILITYKAGATIRQLTGRLNIPNDEAFNIAQAFQFRSRVLYNPSKSFKDFLSPIFLAGCLQSALVLTATLAVDHSIYTRRRRERIGYAAGKTLFYSLLSSISFLLCFLVQTVVFKTTFRGNLISALILAAGLSFAVSSFCVLISAVMKNRVIALIAGAVVFIPNAVMAGTTWPLGSMPVGYQSFAHYMPFAHFAVNLRDIYLKGVSLTHLQGDVIYLVAFGFIVAALTECVVLAAEQTTEIGVMNDNGLFRSVKKGVPSHI